MMGVFLLPLILLFWFGILSALFWAAIKLINYFRTKAVTAKPIPYYWAFILASVCIIVMIYNLLTFDGPWIN